MKTQKKLLLSRGDIENLYAFIGEALDVIDQYHSGDDPELSEDPDYAMDLILQRLEEASEILESWLRKLEDEQDQ
ncbi:MAG: hypothetical protein LM573_07385 [Thermofilum sp.]|nr:hypothetical protein [Thermofilum sp.]